MSAVLSEVLAANQKYSESFREKTQVALQSTRRFAALTCMGALAPTFRSETSCCR
jgi:hypothetical protein